MLFILALSLYLLVRLSQSAYAKYRHGMGREVWG